MKTPDAHILTIQQEFTKQAVAYSQSPVIADGARLAALVAFAEANPEDKVLDVASGPGLVSLAFAPEEDKADLRVCLEDDAIHFTFHTVMLMGKHAGSR